MARRLKVLLSAYACEPGKGSEPGIGWNVACEMAKHHDVWVLTRANNRACIEAALREHPVPGLQFIYYDLPRWARWWKRGQRGVNLYYYLWQWGALGVLRALHRRERFDIAHHLTFVRYWMPSSLAMLDVPFVWGPLGGAEFIDERLRAELPLRTRLQEAARRAARWLGEHDPLVLFSARRAQWVMAATRETQTRLRGMGVAAELYPAVGIAPDEIVAAHHAGRSAARTLRVVSIGRLDPIKGVWLTLRAVSLLVRQGCPIELSVVGDGPERASLERLSRKLDIAAQVRFTGSLTREQILRLLDSADALVNLGLRESGGSVSVEAIARGCPVVTLERGGAVTLVPRSAGVHIEVARASVTVEHLAAALRALFVQPERGVALASQAREYALTTLSWPAKVAHYCAGYARLVESGAPR